MEDQSRESHLLLPRLPKFYYSNVLLPLAITKATRLKNNRVPSSSFKNLICLVEE